MTSRTSATEEGLRREIVDPQPRSSADQSSEVASPSSPTDSKRSDAARLARELGSSSPWSEALMPQTYGTMSPPVEPNNALPITRQEFENIDQTASIEPQDIDAPPAYSRTAPANEVSPLHEPSTEITQSEPADTPIAQEEHETEAELEVESPPDTDREQNQTTIETIPDVETPLLSGPLQSQSNGGRRGWNQKGRTKRRRFLRLFCAAVFFIVVMLILLCVALSDSGNGSSYLQPPAKTTQPFVPTGPDYRRHESVEDINGAYKLYDWLELTTSTGSIDIEIEPEAGDHPAVLILSSDFGSVTLRVSADYLKRRKRVQRTVHTEIRSLTGSVGAEILLGHGGYTLVDTGTGTQNLWVLGSGIGPADEVSNLTTLSRTGTQKIFLIYLEAPYKPISKLRAEHHTFGTASLDVTYPAVWLGELHTVAAPFGKATVSGDGLQYQRQERDFVEAYRGLGENFTLVEVISEGTGSATFRC